VKREARASVTEFPSLSLGTSEGSTLFAIDALRVLAQYMSCVDI